MIRRQGISTNINLLWDRLPTTTWRLQDKGRCANETKTNLLTSLKRHSFKARLIHMRVFMYCLHWLVITSGTWPISAEIQPLIQRDEVFRIWKCHAGLPYTVRLYTEKHYPMPPTSDNSRQQTSHHASIRQAMNKKKAMTWHRPMHTSAGTWIYESCVFTQRWLSYTSMRVML